MPIDLGVQGNGGNPHGPIGHAIDEDVHATHFGFIQGTGTPEAIQLTRRFRWFDKWPHRNIKSR